VHGAPLAATSGLAISSSFPKPGVAAMAAAIQEVVRSSDITIVGLRCDGPTGF
jgi:hypothetical protein